MRLFLSSLVLAVAVVFSALFLFDSSVGYLRAHLLLVMGSAVGGAALLGLFLAVMESRHDNQRQRKRQSFFRDPAQSFQVSLSPQTALAAGSENLVQDIPMAETVTTAPVPAEIQEPAPSEGPIDGVEALSPAASEESVPAQEPEPVPEPEPVVELGPADKTLYLAHDFEFSEIQRVFRIWHMIPVEEDNAHNILGRWSIEGGTTVDVISDKDGSPCIEIRGPMADELAEFLPKDLPVYPTQPNNAELM